MKPINRDEVADVLINDLRNILKITDTSISTGGQELISIASTIEALICKAEYALLLSDAQDDLNVSELLLTQLEKVSDARRVRVADLTKMLKDESVDN